MWVIPVSASCQSVIVGKKRPSWSRYEFCVMSCYESDAKTWRYDPVMNPVPNPLWWGAWFITVHDGFISVMIVVLNHDEFISVMIALWIMTCSYLLRLCCVSWRVHICYDCVVNHDVFISVTTVLCIMTSSYLLWLRCESRRVHNSYDCVVHHDGFIPVMTSSWIMTGLYLLWLWYWIMTWS